MKLPLLTGLVLAASLIVFAPITSLAIDPLPPELEKASLEKKAAYWQKSSREGGELRHQVAVKRWEEGQVRKRAMIQNLEHRAETVRSELAMQAAVSQGKPPTENPEPSGSESSIVLYLMIGGMLVGGGYLMHQRMQEAEQTS